MVPLKALRMLYDVVIPTSSNVLFYVEHNYDKYILSLVTSKFYDFESSQEELLNLLGITTSKIMTNSKDELVIFYKANCVQRYTSKLVEEYIHSK